MGGKKAIAAVDEAEGADAGAPEAGEDGGSKRKRRRGRRRRKAAGAHASAGVYAPSASGAAKAGEAPGAGTAASEPSEPASAGTGSPARTGAAAPEAAPSDGAEPTGDGAAAPPDAQAEAPAAAPRKKRRRRKRRGAKARARLADGSSLGEAALTPPRRIRRPLPVPPPRPKGPDVSVLRPTRAGVIKMRGRTDKGRRWVQDTDLATAINLVIEHAAVVVNPYTIRRLYSSRSFRQYILERDKYTCFFCGEYGNTIDHLVPRSKSGHTTPINCVCACHLCNQSKASRDLDDFYEDE
ncbi:HNH endonuclease [Paenibacillus sp. CC-CFT747]|nr:HNH endonuclease [Paenibacillus sp. CC-CFT747]